MQTFKFRVYGEGLDGTPAWADITHSSETVEKAMDEIQDEQKHSMRGQLQVNDIAKVVVVCRHPGAIEWIPANIVGGYSVTKVLHHFDDHDISDLTTGDKVAGILPLDLAANVCSKGAEFYNLSMSIPADMRGVELSAEHMTEFGAKLERFEIKRSM